MASDACIYVLIVKISLTRVMMLVECSCKLLVAMLMPRIEDFEHLLVFPFMIYCMPG